MERDPQSALKRVAELEQMLADVVAGKSVACKVCHLDLAYFDLGSGRHPGVYCPTGCTQVLMNVVKKDK